ncbi:iron chelate uptake ABC transporter family permease subunit [Candidatus Methanomassiliicoccus intestinalis]|uniref:iron chelate uptake ABC transporter family permease subunit n=1 Tax=Candidatus Methanomassiliicoccus intestinalis TaxID=1406512 RepID=UPI0037DD5088
MNNRQILSILIVALLVAVAVVPTVSSAETTDDAPQILIDYGNGQTQWLPAATSGSYLEMTTAAAAGAGIELTANGTITSIGEFANTRFGGSSGVTTSWKLYTLDENGRWQYDARLSAAAPADGQTFAWGFYPDSAEVICPVVTPAYPSAWTTIGGSSVSDNISPSYGPQNLTFPPQWYLSTDTGYLNSGIVCAEERIYFTTAGSMTSKEGPFIYCLNKDNGEVLWKYNYPIGNGNELTTPLIIGELLILSTSSGGLYCFDRFSGEVLWIEEIPFNPPLDENGNISWSGRTFLSGPSTPAYDSGAVYFGAADGKVYCYKVTKEEAQQIWVYDSQGCIYYTKPTFATVNGERVLYIGNYEGYVHALKAESGELLWKKEAINYITEGKQSTPGSVDSISIGPDVIIVCCSDGTMSKTYGRMLALDPASGEEIWRGDYLTSNPVIFDDGFVFYSISNIYKLDWSGKVIWTSVDLPYIKADLTAAAGLIYGMEYSRGGSLISLDAASGRLLQKVVLEPYTNTSYSMVQPTVIDGLIYTGNDGGFIYCVSAAGEIPSVPGGNETSYGFNHWSWYLTIVLIISMIGALIYLLKYHDDSHLSEIKRKKRRFLYIAVFGTITSVIAFFISLSISSGGVVPINEAVTSLISAVNKVWHGNIADLTNTELYIYNARLPRAIGAIAVGVGLSIAGCMYQAIIRNPLVDPYITGVSSGAGCIAVAAMAFNITLPFLAPDSNYIIPVAAIVGGLLAFAATMFIAEKSGGNSVNYILGGVIVGFAFSSIQTIFVSLAGNKLQDVMYWLFGSFSNVTWENAWLIFIPAMGISLISLLWAREFNLVVVGEEQAKQMGLNVKTFNRIMLVIASILTAICVAFVGIIGFVGLVVPHACRLLMGGDNRLVMPASIILGAMLMLSSDIIARMALMPLELPVGAITAIIGTPVFAYMLIKKGGNYDG